VDWARDDGVLGVPFCRAERWEGPQGGLGCVANTGVIWGRFWICGNGWTYGRIFGSVASKGVTESCAGKRVHAKKGIERSAGLNVNEHAEA